MGRQRDLGVVGLMMLANTYNNILPPFAVLWLLTVVFMAWLPRATLRVARRGVRRSVSVFFGTGVLFVLLLLALLFNMQLHWEILHDEYATDDMRAYPWGYIEGWWILLVSGLGAYAWSALTAKTGPPQRPPSPE